MAIIPNYEALKVLASFSIDKEFCQKVGGKVFGYSDEAMSVYQSLCQQFSLLMDDMVGDLLTIKTHIPVRCRTKIGQAVP